MREGGGGCLGGDISVDTSGSEFAPWDVVVCVGFAWDFVSWCVCVGGRVGRVVFNCRMGLPSACDFRHSKVVLVIYSIYASFFCSSESSTDHERASFLGTVVCCLASVYRMGT